MPICGTNNNLDNYIGKIYMPPRLTDHLGNDVEPQPLYIIRRATREEYKAQSKLHISWRRFYYEVSTD